MFLSHGFDLLEGNVHAMDSPPTREMEMSSAQIGPFIQGSSSDPSPSWGTLLEPQALAKHYFLSSLTHSTITKPTGTYRFKPWTT
jgi:hypothetical protein